MTLEFLRAFESMNRSVVWKWEVEEDVKVPANVFMASWLPQQDLLAHPNLRVFVTHCGMLSTMEAIHHGVVLVGLPFGVDQRAVLMRLVERNAAVLLELSELDAGTLMAAINRAFEDQTMADSMSELSRLFRDVPMRPVEKAAWWVEFVCRHKGAHFLKPRARHLPWYKYHNLDICLAITVLILLVMWGIGKLTEKVCYALYSFRNKAKQD